MATGFILSVIKFTKSGQVRSHLESESGFRKCSGWLEDVDFLQSERSGRRNREFQPKSEKNEILSVEIKQES